MFHKKIFSIINDKMGFGIIHGPQLIGNNGEVEDALRVLTFTECDLTTIDMIYFGNTMLQYSLLLKYLDFSYNRIGDIGTISFINSFVTSPTGIFPMHHVINLNLSNGIGDEGAGHIAAYLKGGYLPALKSLNVSGNNITDTGIGHFIKSMESLRATTLSVVLKVANTTADIRDFVVKGLKYAIDQHAQTQWEVDKIRSNLEGGKWKDCQDTAMNVHMGIVSGGTKCLALKEQKAIFVCLAVEGAIELLHPETLNCLGVVNRELWDFFDD